VEFEELSGATGTAREPELSAVQRNGEATNRDDALIGAGLAYRVVMVLFLRLAVAHPMPVAPMP
jgi:hypothetical protein